MSRLDLTGKNDHDILVIVAQAMVDLKEYDIPALGKMVSAHEGRLAEIDKRCAVYCTDHEGNALPSPAGKAPYKVVTFHVTRKELLATGGGSVAAILALEALFKLLLGGT